MDKGFTIWFTGLPCSGKSTIAKKVEEKLREKGYDKIEILDGDELRTNLSKELGFSREDRDIHIKRIGFICKLLSRNGVISIVAAISPYRGVREFNRREIGNFIEVYCKCPLKVCIQRDIKGLYRKAIQGEIKNFTGIDDPYEEPLNPEVILMTDKETIEESANKVIEKLESLGYLKEKTD